MDEQHAFEAIMSEREYQDKEWPRSKALPVTGEILLLEEYLNQFRKNYQKYDDGKDLDVPEVCLHDLRKMATILVRAMVNGGVRYRELNEE
jgi:hypothetical protein